MTTVDELHFEYDDELNIYVSGIGDIDIVIQPVDSGFLAEAVDGTKVHKLGEFVSERWAQVAALDKAKELAAAREIANRQRQRNEASRVDLATRDQRP